MNKLVWFFFAGIFLLQTACNIQMPGIPMKTTPELPKETLFHSEETTTPLAPNWQVTVSVTLEIPTETITPILTDETESPPQFPEPTPTKIYPKNLLDVQPGSPVAISNFAHPEFGCDWMGLAGQIIDINGQPIKDIVVEVGGTLEGVPIFGLAVTGESSIYGPGGFEIKLGDEPIDSDGTLWVVVYDLDGNKIISPVFFSTYSDCEKNLIVMNFVKVLTISSDLVYLPVILNEISQP